MSDSEPSSSPEPRAHVRYERGVPHNTFDLAEGAEELFDLGGDYRITLTCSRPAGATHTAMVAAGSTNVPKSVFKELEALAVEPSKITYDMVKPFEDEVNELVRQLTATHQRAIALANWRIGASGPHGTTTGYKRFWSLDCGTWQEMPFGLGQFNVRTEILLKWLPDVRRSYGNLLRAGVTEPIAYNLLIEALRLRDIYPRSALVIGIAALEVGVKQRIADLASDTDWLMTNLLSPPVVDLLWKYLPTLKPKANIKGGKILQPPKAFKRTIQRAVEVRNSLVHRTGERLKDLDLDETLKAVRDVLYLLEVYQGHEWAVTCMRHETVASIMTEAGLA